MRKSQSSKSDVKRRLMALQQTEVSEWFIAKGKKFCFVSSVFGKQRMEKSHEFYRKIEFVVLHILARELYEWTHVIVSEKCFLLNQFKNVDSV